MPAMCHRGIWMAVLAAGAAIGCSEPTQPTGPTVARISVADPDEFERLWESATDVLRAHCLEPDRQDRQARVITTLPDTSPQWFEFWHPFPTSSAERTEANLQTVRRRAEVRFDPAAQAHEYDMTVRVDVDRYCLLERQATNAASAFQIFGVKLPTTEGRMDLKEATAYWEPLGRDGYMESALIDRILRRFGQEGQRIFESPPSPDTQPASPP